MDIGERPCELPEGSTQLRDSADPACAGAGAPLLSATINDVQRALVEDDDDEAEFDDSELHIVVDQSLPLPEPPRSSWMPEEDPVRFILLFQILMLHFHTRRLCV